MKYQAHTIFVIGLATVMSLCISAQHVHDESEGELKDPTQLSGVELYDWLGIDGYYTDAYSDDELQKTRR